MLSFLCVGKNYNTFITKLHRKSVLIEHKKKDGSKWQKQTTIHSFTRGKTAHILRHSLNTNLLANDVSPVMTAYYLAWQHQALIDMQQRYTHLQAMKLKSVADNIDIMFPIPEDGAIQKTC